ncbi:TPA: hypothetical protein ACRNCK_005295 [Pseudomonas aeruginosa]|uniref:hypothetical protein n=1 Tax=Pseudomonas aeruginosa TaxID=287 RepID=UPI001574DACE|nr:hypothetical protein [Pseudomonas aeruginosa]NTT93918.1 hypothetical protein [Pseudomonas aeruginosa]HCF3158022.1 hypothetical protein [Pseudomonas aeruginosa]HDR2972456.1 hypothetical protein [Pseudomonas aeruginosa]
MSALLKINLGAPLPKGSHFEVRAGLKKSDALFEASCLLSGLSDILNSLIEGTAMNGSGFYALGYLSDSAKALVDAATPTPAEEAEIVALLNAKEGQQ